MGAYRRFTLVMVAVALGLIGHGGGGQAEGADLRPGAWTFGAGLGFLGGTPDGTAFALNLNADAGLIEHLSLGPLMPLGAGADYALNDLFHITGTLLINFTNLDTGRPGGGADVMPGFTVGVRF